MLQKFCLSFINIAPLKTEFTMSFDRQYKSRIPREKQKQQTAKQSRTKVKSNSCKIKTKGKRCNFHKVKQSTGDKYERELSKSMQQRQRYPTFLFIERFKTPHPTFPIMQFNCFFLSESA